MSKREDLIERGAGKFNILYAWLCEAKKVAPEVCDWIGIYFKESFIKSLESEDLLLGPFIGRESQHKRIPIHKGMCGLALRENKIVNVGDVRKEKDYLSCSIDVRSELVIPLKSKQDESIAELDIDSNKIAAFTSSIQEKFEAFAKTFSNLNIF